MTKEKLVKILTILFIIIFVISLKVYKYNVCRNSNLSKDFCLLQY